MSNQSQHLPLDIARRDAARLACTLGLHYLALAEIDGAELSPEAAHRYSIELEHGAGVHMAVRGHIRDGMGEEAVAALMHMDYAALEEAARACGASSLIEDAAGPPDGSLGARLPAAKDD